MTTCCHPHDEREDDQDGKRPEFVEIHLHANGTHAATAEVKEAEVKEETIKPNKEMGRRKKDED